MIKTRNVSEVYIFEILKNKDGEVELSGQILKETLGYIDQCFEGNHRQIAINLQGVGHISEDAIGALVTKRSSKGGLMLCFYGMSPKLRDAMRHSGFLSIFSETIFESEKEMLVYLRTTN